MPKKTSSIPGTKSAAPSTAAQPQQQRETQAQRLLEIARKARQGGSGQSFSRAMGKATLSRNARKAGKGQVGGSNV